MSNVMAQSKSEALSDLNVTNFEIDFLRYFLKLTKLCVAHKGTQYFIPVGDGWGPVGIMFLTRPV